MNRLLRRAKRGLLYAGAFTLGGALAQMAPPAGRLASMASAASSESTRRPPALHPKARYARSSTRGAPQGDSLAAEPVVLEGGLVMTGRTQRRMILFTFDDGPDERNTPALLDHLDRYGIKAVFFLTANRMAERTPWGRRHRELAREIVRRGHLVGNHTMNHPRLARASEARLEREIEATSAFIDEVTGVRPVLFRPPGGIRSPELDAFVAERGYTTMLWNIGAGDFQVDTASLVEKTFFRVFERRRREHGDRGGIVLLHDTYPHTVEAFPRIVERLLAENCRLLAAGEELYDFVDDPRLFFAARRDASPSAEAPPAELAPEVLAERQARLRAETRARCGR